MLHQKATPVASDGGPGHANVEPGACLAAACPSMDLVAFASANQIIVNRSIPTVRVVAFFRLGYFDDLVF